MPSWMHSHHDGVTLDLFVQPRASKNRIVGVQGDELKVSLTSPPVDGAANALCRDFFAKLLKRSKGSVTLLSGEKSRHKKVLIEGVSIDEVRQVVESALEKE